MTSDERRQCAERAGRRSIIETIEISLGKLNGNLSDDRKIRLFRLNQVELKKLAVDLKATQTRIKAISLIVAALGSSEPELPTISEPSQRLTTPRKRKIAKAIPKASAKQAFRRRPR